MSHTLHPLCFSKSLMEKLKEHGITKNYAAGTIILKEHVTTRSIPIVLEGTLKISKTEKEGREILLYYVKTGESCVSALLSGVHQTANSITAQVEEDAILLFLPIEKASFFLKEYPEWLSYFLQLYHQRFEELIEMIEAIAFKKVDERLMDLLKKKEKLSNSSVLQITHEQLAIELGTARVVVSRLLKHLETNGKVELQRNKITIL